MPTVAILAISLGLFVLLLVPTRRLQLAGWSSRALGGYLTGMLVVGLAIVLLPISARLAVPVLVVGYLAPFVVARVPLERLRRVSRRPITVERSPIKTVTGPARDARTDADTADGRDAPAAPADASRGGPADASRDGPADALRNGPVHGAGEGRPEASDDERGDPRVQE